MKYLLEFSKLKDQALSRDAKWRNLIDADFQEDEPLIDKVYMGYEEDPEHDKVIFLDWYDAKHHSIIQKIQDRTSFNHISDFNSVIEYGIKQMFPEEIGKTIDGGGRYSVHFNNHNFYLIISLNYENLFDDDAKIMILTISPNAENLDVIEIYDD